MTKTHAWFGVWGLTLLAAAMLMITMGARQTMGLFVSPINTSTGLGLTAVSLAMAVAQFVWGAVQPVAGALSDRYGSGRVLAGGVLLLALGTVLTPWMSSTAGLVLTIGVLSAAGAGAGSFSVLIGAVAQRIPAARRGMASGIINAGGSFGQFLFAPLVQALILAQGWRGAMWSVGLLSLAALPLAFGLRRPQGLMAQGQNSQGASSPAGAEPAPHASTSGGLAQALRVACRDRSYLMLHLGFFTCGFHIAFLVTHLPGEVSWCGLPADVASWSLAIIGLFNIAGSLVIGWLLQFVRGKYLLFWMYASRTLLIGVYLLAPKTELTFYIFAAGLGFTWLATVPPTAAVVGKLFGVRHLGTLFGLTLLSHQTGGFFGAWLGGLAMSHTGSFQWMWWADMALALGAALCNLPIREARVTPRPAVAPA